MKKIIFVMSVVILLASGIVITYSIAQTTTPSKADCQLDQINAAIDNAIAAIKSSPAFGEAGGHFKKAIVDLEKTKKQLAEGCNRWVKGGEKTKKK